MTHKRTSQFAEFDISCRVTGASFEFIVSDIVLFICAYQFTSDPKRVLSSQTISRAVLMSDLLSSVLIIALLIPSIPLCLQSTTIVL